MKFVNSREYCLEHKYPQYLDMTGKRTWKIKTENPHPQLGAASDPAAAPAAPNAVLSRDVTVPSINIDVERNSLLS